MPIVTEARTHGLRTTRSGYQYQFTPKHHGGDATAAQWLPVLTFDQEFAVFDSADERELADDEGRLYGVRLDSDGGLLYVGVWHEQVAEFPRARDEEAWHGYPVYPLVNEGPQNRRGQRGRPAAAVFGKMVQAGLLTQSQRRRLMKGDHA